LRNIPDLLRKDISIVNREPGSGCRKLLDEQLAEHGIPREKVRCN